MFVQQAQWGAARQALECVVVDAEAQVACQRDVAHVFPTAAVHFVEFFQAVGFALQALKCQSFNPFGEQQFWHLPDGVGAWQFYFCVHQLGIFLVEFG